MVKYRRLKVDGGRYFFTLALHDRRSGLLTRHIDCLGRAFRRVKLKYPFTTDAIVVLPEHLHFIMQLPEDDADFPTRLRLMKYYFSQSVITAGEDILKNNRGEYELWQSRFWEHFIRHDIDYANHANYIHYNPVKHKLVRQVQDWPYSSFHRYVKAGKLPINWGGKDDEGDYGE